MAIRIYHTADNHIGISFSQYDDAVAHRLIEERFAALERMVATANARQAHFFVVAGDLFDKPSVTTKDVKRTVEVLSRFEGEAVLVLAGNHDFCEGADSKLWATFRKAAEGTAVLALTAQGTKDFSLDEGIVRFYACPCPVKHSGAPMTDWVTAEPKDPDMLHIGVAHGNVEGLGRDADQRYFNMTETALRAAGLHAWLLGHIHVPSPDPGTTGKPTFFMPGIHTPDSVRCKHAGHAWWVELEADGISKFEQLTTGALRFVRLSHTLEHADHIAALQRECDAIDAPNTVLDLQLSGRLREVDLTSLNNWAAALTNTFLHVRREQDIDHLLDSATIASRYPDGTLPHALLTELLADTEHPGDAYLALQLIEEYEKR